MIQGLIYQRHYLTTTEENQLLTAIDQQQWEYPFKRRVQQYGYSYDYRRRTVDESLFLGALPAWIAPLACRLHDDGFFTQIPDQVIINDYVTGQGIAPHVDCEPCFEDTIVSISLGSSCMMDFYALEDDTTYHQFLESCSLVCMQGEARYKWKHGISARKSDIVNDERIQRNRRVSLTFRKTILTYSK